MFLCCSFSGGGGLCVFQIHITYHSNVQAIN